MTGGGRLPRPERFLAPVLVAAVLLLAWAAVAHASGSGFVQAVGALAAGLVAIGMFVPGVLARRLRIFCSEAPSDATSGAPMTITVETARSLRCTPISARGETVFLQGRASSLLTIVPPYRGQLTSLRVRLATAAPLGLLWWSVEREVALPRAVLVAPPAAEHGAVSEPAGQSGDGSAAPGPALSGEIRQVRQYRHGDSPRHVHWRATAHSGSLMVRESEDHPGAPVRVTADLVGDAATTEVRARAAMATIAAHLGAGDHVVLETVESARPLVAPVSDLRSAGRRLARSGTNPYATNPYATNPYAPSQASRRERPAKEGRAR
jgi:uncharacterized protein (DUF58 family)